MPKTIARLLGLAAYAACGGIAAAYVLVAFVSRDTATGGMDATMTHVTWLALGGVTLAIIFVHHVVGRQFLLIAREGDTPQPLGAR